MNESGIPNNSNHWPTNPTQISRLSPSSCSRASHVSQSVCQNRKRKAPSHDNNIINSNLQSLFYIPPHSNSGPTYSEVIIPSSYLSNHQHIIILKSPLLKWWPSSSSPLLMIVVNLLIYLFSLLSSSSYFHRPTKQIQPWPMGYLLGGGQVSGGVYSDAQKEHLTECVYTLRRTTKIRTPYLGSINQLHVLPPTLKKQTPTEIKLSHPSSGAIQSFQNWRWVNGPWYSCSFVVRLQVLLLTEGLGLCELPSSVFCATFNRIEARQSLS